MSKECVCALHAACVILATPHMEPIGNLISNSGSAGSCWRFALHCTYIYMYLYLYLYIFIYIYIYIWDSEILRF